VNNVAAFHKIRRPVRGCRFGNRNYFRRRVRKGRFRAASSRRHPAHLDRGFVQQDSAVRRLSQPEKLIENNTVASMQSGLYARSVIDGIVGRLIAELGPHTRVVTGGQAHLSSEVALSQAD
jgi:hypothetical protein